jgi:Transposase DDE domain
MSALPLIYVVKSANVNDKDVAKPLLKQAPRLINNYGKRISHVIADRQYYSEDVFAALRKLEAAPVIPYPPNVKEPMLDLWLIEAFQG